MLPFASVRPVVVVASPQIWLDRIATRAERPNELQARLAEAKQSLEWSLDNKDALFVDNSSVVNATANNLICTLEYGPSNLRAIRNIANAMLAACAELQ
jgi:ribose 1,5-bisphosphokinase PhnN